MPVPSDEAWPSDQDLADAAARFAATTPGFALPAAYAVARLDGTELTFGHVNDFGAVRPLPAAVLASVCGHGAHSATYELTTEQFASAVRLLTPAEAATHIPHPNLWSWRALLEAARPDSVFLVFFLRGIADPPVHRCDEAFRGRLTPP